MTTGLDYTPLLPASKHRTCHIHALLYLLSGDTPHYLEGSYTYRDLHLVLIPRS